MPLQHFPGNSSLVNLEPVYQDRFEVTIQSSKLTEKDKLYLLDNIVSINRNKFIVNVNDNFKVNELLLSIDGEFTMIVKIHDMEGHVISILEYYDCIFNNLGFDFLNYSYDAHDILKYEIEFNYESFNFYNRNNFEQYLRKEKIKRLLN